MPSALVHPDCLAATPAGLRPWLTEYVEVDVDRMSGAAKAALLQEVVQGESMLASLRLRILASADRSRAAAEVGAASTGQWAARLANDDQAAAQRQVALAQGLERRTITQRALASGGLTPAHAAVIVRADRELPTAVSADDRERVETALVERARSVSPEALRRAARRALAAVEHDVRLVDAHENSLVATEEEAARRRTRLTLHDNADGTVTGHFTVPTVQGHLLRKILEAMTAPRRGRHGSSEAQVGAVGPRVDQDHARGAAFCELLEHLPTDHLHPRTAATLVVTVELDTLREALRVAHLDTGVTLSAGEVRRLGCNAGIIPAVLGGTPLPLDLGRSTRLFTEAQRTALGLSHRTCAADGCERPFAWCEMHHGRPWSHGGRTDLHEAVPLCHFHHRRVHDQLYEHRREPNGAITFHRRT